MLIRCSSLPKIMTESRSKDPLSKTAKNYLIDLARQDFFSYNNDVDNKYIQKGNECEQDSIKLLNDVLFTSYTKNKERVYSEFLTGECDIKSKDLIIDIKTSWSINTFPFISSEINPSDYEWQLRGYMHLYNVSKSKLAYCLVNTPVHLIGFEKEEFHIVDHIDCEKRVTFLEFKRDKALERKMLEKCKYAIDFYLQYINQLENK